MKLRLLWLVLVASLPALVCCRKPAQVSSGAGPTTPTRQPLARHSLPRGHRGPALREQSGTCVRRPVRIAVSHPGTRVAGVPEGAHPSPKHGAAGTTVHYFVTLTNARRRRSPWSPSPATPSSFKALGPGRRRTSSMATSSNPFPSDQQRRTTFNWMCRPAQGLVPRISTGPQHAVRAGPRGFDPHRLNAAIGASLISGITPRWLRQDWGAIRTSLVHHYSGLY